jgi:glycosyltransferase involved in cell wall biosynthesis
MVTQRPLRVLVVISSDQRRGGEIQGLSLAARLAERDAQTGQVVQTTAVALSRSTTTPRLEVSCLGGHPLALRTLRALRQRAREHDVVVAYGGTTLPACALALLATGVPFVYRSIGDPTAWVRGDLHRRRTGLFMRRAKAVAVLWPGAADSIRWLYGLPRSRVAVIPNPPADLAAPLEREEARSRFGLPVTGSVVAVVGSLTDEKRVDRAIDVMGRLPGAHLLVVGDGPLRSELAERADEVLPGRHTFVGAVSDVENAYAASDLLLLTSSTEGFPGVLVEAAERGVPSVAPRVGAIEWMAERGLVSATFDPDADDEEIARLCSRHLQDTDHSEAATQGHRFESDTTEMWRSLLDGVIAGTTWSGEDLSAPDPLRVVLVIDSLQPAGAERSTALLAEGLVARGVPCTVVVLRRAGGELEDRLALVDVPLVVLPDGHTPGRVRALRRLLRSHRPDIVHTTLFTSDIVGRLAAIGLPSRVVASLVSMPRQARRGLLPGATPMKTRVVNAIDRVTGRLVVDRYQAVTAGVAQAFERAYRIDPSRITVVERGRPDPAHDLPVGVGLLVRSSFGLAEDARLVVAVGRHARSKGFPDLVRAFARVAREDDRAVLVIAGRDGDDSVETRAALAAHPGLEGRVLLVGHRDDVPALLTAADLFVLSSHAEGAAGAVIEAMAARAPIVATRLEGLIGVLDDDRNAVLCEVGDVVGLASAILRVLGDPVLAQRLAAAAQADYERRFTLDRSVEATVTLYRDVLDVR